MLKCTEASGDVFSWVGWVDLAQNTIKLVRADHVDMASQHSNLFVQIMLTQPGSNQTGSSRSS